MKPVVVSRRAREDLREISEFVAVDNPSRARGFIAEPRTRYPALGRQAMMGRPAPGIARDVRILVFRSYLILHRGLDVRISIDRVVHSARDRSTLPPDE